MPTYDYKCEDHGYFQAVNRMADHARAECPTCGETVRQVLRTPPALDNTAMANAGMPGAIEKQGNQMTKRHRSVSQAHRPVAE